MKIVIDVKSLFQHRDFGILTGNGYFGDQKFTLGILKVLSDNFEEDYDRAEHPEKDFDETEKDIHSHSLLLKTTFANTMN